MKLKSILQNIKVSKLDLQSMKKIVWFLSLLNSKLFTRETLSIYCVILVLFKPQFLTHCLLAFVLVLYFGM